MRVFIAMPSLVLILQMLAFSVLILGAAPAHAEERLDYSAFGILPLVHEGRIKPLESFARVHLKQFSGSEFYEGDRPAIEWLAESLFNPAHAASFAVFSVQNRWVRDRLGLSADKKLFSLPEIQDALLKIPGQLDALAAKPSKSLSADEQALLALYKNLDQYNQILRSLSLVLPLNLDVPTEYADTKTQPVFLDLIAAETKIAKDVQKIIQRRGTDPARYSEKEAALASLSFQLSLIRQGGEGSMLLRIMPALWKDGGQQDWFSPWALLLSGKGSPQSSDYLLRWRAMADAYRDRDVSAWKASAEDTLRFVLEKNPDELSRTRFQAERLYTTLDPYRWASVLYGSVCGLLLFMLLGGPARVKKIFLVQEKAIKCASSGILTAALLLHSFGLGLRILILQRPPVGTLYESLLFVALIVPALATSIFIFRKNPAVLAAGALGGFILLLAAPVTNTDAESLDVLSAVLNTNFWLGTHVLIITAGYGLCILASLLAHGVMIARFISGPSFAGVQALCDLAYKVSLAALLFTCVGTILGGIWADQSWGRFWGWDPKENGALLIVLWLIWTQHGRLSGHLRPLPFMAMLAALNVIVALAWFGVNLLSVGLHSYGFTSGLAAGLGLFCAAEILLIGGLWYGIRKREAS